MKKQVESMISPSWLRTILSIKEEHGNTLWVSLSRPRGYWWEILATCLPY